VVEAPAPVTPVEPTPPPPVDRCSNIPGVQATLPVRTAARADGTCWTTSSFRADVLWGSGRGELFRSGAGNDVVRAGGGADRIFGERGNDRLFGQAGNDRLVGGPGRDRLDGGAGNDVLDARDRARGDVVTCGRGRDTVWFNRGDRVARDCEIRRLAR
jgi:Ca2+-binding RTX toxin-like protein